MTSRFRPVSGCYFPLTRLWRALRGFPCQKAEGNSIEAHLGGILIFAITYFFLADLLPAQFSGWRLLLVHVALLFATSISWLIALYFNSVIIRGLQVCGFLRATAGRRAQDIFILTLVTLFAVELSIHNSWTRWIGLACLLLIAANAIAALLLVGLGFAKTNQPNDIIAG